MYENLATEEVIEATKLVLLNKGYEVDAISNKKEVLELIKSVIPAGARVMHGSSVSLEEIGYVDYLKQGKHGWKDLKGEINAENDPEKRHKLRQESVLTDYYLGSVHALLQNGEFIVASRSGSQLPMLSFTAINLILVVGVQKIVKDWGEGMKRLVDYVMPLEEKHMQNLYGAHTELNKILWFKGETVTSGRKIRIILVKEKLGY